MRSSWLIYLLVMYDMKSFSAQDENELIIVNEADLRNCKERSAFLSLSLSLLTNNLQKAISRQSSSFYDLVIDVLVKNAVWETHALQLQ